MASRRADSGGPPEAYAAVEPARPASTEPAAGGGRVVRFHAQDGLELAARIFDPAQPASAGKGSQGTSAPEAERLPLLCLPGLSRNSRDFTPLARLASAHAENPRRVVALDLRGRGLSQNDPDWRHYTPLLEAQDVLAAAAAFGIERAVIVGTSRGGIIAMLLGALRPGLLAGVVLNDIGPVIEGAGLARIKKYLSARHPVRSWDEAVAAVRAVSEGQFPDLGEADWRAYAEASFVATASGLAPQFDPRLTRTLEEVDFTQKLPELWPQFMSLSRVPVLAIRGELSDILSPKTLARMAELHPQLEPLIVRRQGHAPLLADRPTQERILAFAERCDPASP